MFVSCSIKVPKYRHHKGSGQAFVQVKGHRSYLGKYASEQSQERYRRFVAELMAAAQSAGTPARPEDAPPGEGLTVVELVAAYWRFAKGYYVKDGRPTGWTAHIRLVLRLLKNHYGTLWVAEFGPLALKALRQKLVEAGHSRKYINKLVAIIPAVFRWGVSEELAPVTVYQALAVVPSLRKGRCPAPDRDPVVPVPDAVVQATLPHSPDTIADMVRLQRLAGCRPGEVCIVRPCDIDRSGDVWIYRPKSHKAEHHGRERIIFIGPKAQDILRPYLLRETESFCFNPKESERHRRMEQRALRKTKVQPSQRNRQKPNPSKKIGDHYTRDSYRRAIHRACDLAGLERWGPNRLRHSCATEVRRKFGLEAAQIVLGHATADVTQVYAERDAVLAKDVMRKIG